jgi:formate hydrogenlyase transcriptional activator
MILKGTADPGADVRRYEALLDMADLMVQHQELPELFRELAERLRKVVAFEFANFSLHDPNTERMLVNVWTGDPLVRLPLKLNIEESPSGWVWQHQLSLNFTDITQDERFPVVLGPLRQSGLKSYFVTPLTTAEKRLGALGLASDRVGSYEEGDINLIRRIAELVAVMIENSRAHEELKQERVRLKALVEVNQALVSNLDLPGMFPAISESLRQIVKVDYASVALFDGTKAGLEEYARDLPMHTLHAAPVLLGAGSAGAKAHDEGKVQLFRSSDGSAEQYPAMQQLYEEGVRSGCCIPLITAKGGLGTLNLVSKEGDAFGPKDVHLLEQVAAQVAIALDNARAYREIAELRDKLAEEKLYLEDEIRSELNFEEIVGESTSLKRVLAQAKTVAPSDATVLILGETGTGKELIARAIHRMSLRSKASFIKVNCAAIPTGLLESELFGHERGAFTGAISQKVGRLELADEGTLLLDEIGDIAMELQPKLLRVLQDHEFERLGANRTIRVNVRLIVATNRDLAKSVAEREFRSDLYYRLNVFPIRMPPLRERAKDIPLLVRYFVQKFSRRMNRHIETISADTMNALATWDWPGNVRELENFIERSVILSEGSVLRVPLSELRPVYENAGEGTMREMEREHIVHALRESGGIIAGPRGAASRLGMKRTTLQSRMQKLGISRQEYGN